MNNTLNINAMTHDEVYAAARIFVHKEASTLMAEIKDDRLMLSVEDTDLAAMLTGFYEEHTPKVEG